MSRRENWVRMPKEPAAPWYKLGCYERFVGMQLVMQLDAHDGTGEGLLDASVTRIVRGSIQDRNERQRVRKAVARLQDLGLVFEHGGLVYVLYSHKAWAKHRALGERLAEERLAAGKPAVGDVEEGVSKKARVAGKASAAKRALNPANDNATPAAERCASVDPALTQRWSQNDLNSENHSTPMRRERERLNQSTACSGGEPPAAASPAAVIPLQKAKRKPRAKTPLDRARALALELFNQHYAPRHGGVRSWVGYNLLTPLVGCFMDPEGNFQRERFERTVTAFLDDPRWSAPGERGHGLDVFVWKHSKYARAAAPQIDRSYLEHVL